MKRVLVTLLLLPSFASAGGQPQIKSLPTASQFRSPLSKLNPVTDYKITGVRLDPKTSTTMTIADSVFYASPSSDPPEDPGHIFLRIGDELLLEMGKYVSGDGCTIERDKRRNIVITEDDGGDPTACYGCTIREAACLGLRFNPELAHLVANYSLAKILKETAAELGKKSVRELVRKAQTKFGKGGANLFNQLMMPEGNEFCATAAPEEQTGASSSFSYNSLDSGGNMAASIGRGGAIEGKDLHCGQSAGREQERGRCGSSAPGARGSSGCGGQSISCNSDANSQGGNQARQAFMRNLAKKGQAMEGGGASDGGTQPQEDPNNGSPPPSNDRPIQPDAEAGDVTFHANFKKDSPEELKATKEKINEMCKSGCERTDLINRASGSHTTIMRSRWDGQAWQRISVKGVITPDRNADAFKWKRYETPIEPGDGEDSPVLASFRDVAHCPGDARFVIRGNGCDQATNPHDHMNKTMDEIGRGGAPRPGGDGDDFLSDSSGAPVTPTTFVYDDGMTCTSSQAKKPCLESGDIFLGGRQCRHLNLARIKENMLKQLLWTDPPIYSSGAIVSIDE